MDQIKRKLSFNRSSEENSNDQLKTSIENFSNEFFYEIFDYLDVCIIYEAFSNLNDRFYQLLNSSSLLFKMKLYHSTLKEIFMKNYEEIIRHNKHKLFSIHLSIFTNENQIISLLNIDSSFTHLQSLVLELIKPDILILLLPKLIFLPRLFSLNILTSSTLKNLTDVYQFIFDLPKLRYLKFSVDECEDPNIIISLPNDNIKQISPIEYLVIDHPCTFKEIFAIISYTPQLYRLNLMEISDHNSNIKILSPMILANLNSIYIKMYIDITFNEFEMFISKIRSKLKVLSFTTFSEDITYLDANRWEQLILKYFPHLEKFYFKYSVYYDEDNESLMYDGEANQFISPFWIERQWIYEAEIELYEITYSIRPYKKRWYDHDVQHSVINSSTEFWKSSRLILITDFSEKALLSLTRNIFRILTVAHIFHSEIYEEISISALIEILIFLFSLDSLYISSLSLSDSKDLSDDSTELLNDIIDNNQITKVYLEKLNNIEEIYFLIKLCPRMIYLKIDCINNMNMELFLRNILEKIKHQCNEHFRLLCFRIPAADDQIIQKLDKMISSEKLLLDYTIKRVLECIYLQWK